MQRPMLFATLLYSGLFASAIAQTPTQQQVEQIRASAKNDAPQSRVEGERAMRDAMAGAVIGAIANQFGEREVQIKLDTIRSQQINLIDYTVSGEGHIRLGDNATWIALDYQGLYDPSTATMSAPRLHLGGQDSASALDRKAPLSRQLLVEVNKRIGQEFAQQAVSVTLETVRAQALDGQHLRLVALGAADFGAEGAAATTIDAIYDTRSAAWVRMDYQLDGDSGLASL